MSRYEHYFYVVTVNAKGNRVVIGPYENDSQAEVDAAKSEYDAEVVKLKTRNLARATQMVKGRDYSEVGDINRATHFANHNARTKTGSHLKSGDLLDKIRSTNGASRNIGGTPLSPNTNGHSKKSPYDMEMNIKPREHDSISSGFDSILENKLSQYDL